MSRTKSENDRLRCLFEGFGLTALDDPEMAREILADAGLDPDRLAQEGAALALQLYGKARLCKAAGDRIEMETNVAKLWARITKNLQAKGKDLRTELARLVADSGSSGFQVHFRKIEDLDEEDIRDMLTEYQLLQLLDNLDSTGGSEDNPDSDE